MAAGETAQRSIEPTAVAEDPSLVLGTYIIQPTTTVTPALGV